MAARRIGWPGLGENDATPIDAQQYRSGETARSHSNHYPLGEDVPLVSVKRFGPSVIGSDLLPADLHVRNIEERSRQADGTVVTKDQDVSSVDAALLRIVNMLEILTKPKVIKRGYLTRQVSLTAATVALLINSQTSRGYIIQNTSGIPIYIGNPGVTTVSGYEIASGRSYEFYLEEGALIYAIATNDATIQVMEL